MARGKERRKPALVSPKVALGGSAILHHKGMANGRLKDARHAIKGHVRHHTARSKENGKGKGRPWYKHGTDKNLFLKKNLQRKKNSLPLQPNAEIAQLVEHDLAKVGVASSSLVFRSESRQAAIRLPVLVSYSADGPAERPRCPRGAAFRKEGGGNVEGARQSEAQPRARVSFSALKADRQP